MVKSQGCDEWSMRGKHEICQATLDMKVQEGLRGGAMPRAAGCPVFVKVSPATKLPEGVCRYTTCARSMLLGDPFLDVLVEPKLEK